MKSKIKLILIVLVIQSLHVHAQFNKNQVIAHRGAWKTDRIPQNSIAALNKAVELGCAATEFDVQLTKDHVLVVNHDADFMGMDVATSTLEQLRAVELPNGERLPTAREYIVAGMKQNNTKLIFELKTSSLGLKRTLEAAEMAVALVKELNAQSWVEYILFNYEAAKKIIALDSSALVSYLNGDVSPQQAKDDGFYGLDYHYSVFAKNPLWMKEAQSLGLALNAWTVNNVEDMQLLLDQDIDYITTDEPEVLIKLLSEQQ